MCQVEIYYSSIHINSENCEVKKNNCKTISFFFFENIHFQTNHDYKRVSMLYIYANKLIEVFHCSNKLNKWDEDKNKNKFQLKDGNCESAVELLEHVYVPGLELIHCVCCWQRIEQELQPAFVYKL